jgi:hypothetical protein
MAGLNLYKHVLVTVFSIPWSDCASVPWSKIMRSCYKVSNI